MANEKRLIDANALLEQIEEQSYLVRSMGKVNGKGMFNHTITKTIEDAPTVEAVEVVHGRWGKAEYHGFLRCSECKDVYIDDTWVAGGKWNYCPNCGSLMDGGGVQ